MTRHAVPGFIPWEDNGGGGYRPGDRVRIKGAKYQLAIFEGMTGTVEDAYDRSSDMWSPYCAAVRINFDEWPENIAKKCGPKHNVEFFVRYDGVEKIT